MNGASLPDSFGSADVAAKVSSPSLKQNAYENVFIKLFAQSMLYLLTVFGLLYSFVSIVRELLGSCNLERNLFSHFCVCVLGFKLGFLKLSFWLQIGFNFVLFSLLIFARVKVLTSKCIAFQKRRF